ncbi:hypothetical protein E3N86_00045 [Cryobacterium sp. Hz7]|uniref:hypothetical protein n=1 Tax=Cryobacterium sp. Hz7 TaxID=1259166 RepID=UPI00106A1EC7|nr:hypothetical protein [Cryobacterium sp. Hz7]TFB67200.1 hypothetical protein E3N86_00045 [Cryobacterium sp. Hz7]
MIAVNVSRRARPDDLPDDLRGTCEGWWAGISAATYLDHSGSLLLGVKNNSVIWAGKITHATRREDRRVRFHTTPPTSGLLAEAGIVIGAPAPAWATWRPGQGNPVRIARVARTFVDITDTATHDTIGPFTLRYDPTTNELLVTVPAGARLVVVNGGT